MPLTSQRKNKPAISRSKPRDKPYWRIVFEIVFAMAVVVLGVEFVFALAGIGEQEVLRPDMLTGYIPMEGKHLTWRTEGFSRLTINEHSMQDIPRALTKAENTYRIAVLGDSMVQALEVDRSRNFCALLEQKLNEAQGEKKVEVLNFGVVNYNLGQMYLRLKHQVKNFHPDLVIVALRPDTSFRLLIKPEGGFLHARPSFFVGEDGRLIQDNTIQELWSRSREGKRMHLTSWLRRNSRIYSIAGQALKDCKRWWGDIAGNKTRFGSEGSSQILLTASQDVRSKTTETSTGKGRRPVEKENQCTRQMWPVADALLNAMSNECSEMDAEFVVLRLPQKDGYQNPLETGFLKTSCKRLGLPFLDLTPDFASLTADERKPMFYLFHFAPSGHRLAADRIFEFLTKDVSGRKLPVSAKEKTTAGYAL